MVMMMMMVVVVVGWWCSYCGRGDGSGGVPSFPLQMWWLFLLTRRCGFYMGLLSDDATAALKLTLLIGSLRTISDRTSQEAQSSSSSSAGASELSFSKRDSGAHVDRQSLYKRLE